MFVTYLVASEVEEKQEGEESEDEPVLTDAEEESDADPDDADDKDAFDQSSDARMRRMLADNLRMKEELAALAGKKRVRQESPHRPSTSSGSGDEEPWPSASSSSVSSTSATQLLSGTCSSSSARAHPRTVRAFLAGLAARATHRVVQLARRIVLSRGETFLRPGHRHSSLLIKALFYHAIA